VLGGKSKNPQGQKGLDTESMPVRQFAEEAGGYEKKKIDTIEPITQRTVGKARKLEERWGGLNGKFKTPREQKPSKESRQEASVLSRAREETKADSPPGCNQLKFQAGDIVAVVRESEACE